jgi:1,4-alpha-glucan branching enzyme
MLTTLANNADAHQKTEASDRSQKSSPPRLAKSRVTSASVEKRIADHQLDSLNVRCEFRITAPDACFVSLVGSFNEWDPKRTPMTHRGDHWEVVIELPRGRYEYKFYVDGAWLADPTTALFARNPFGDHNSVLTL